MTPERWRQIKEILEPAAELHGGERAAFLAESCGTDSVLLGEVENLLETEKNEAELFETDAFAPFISNGSRSRIGERIGKYEITDELGTGGMGSVYLARRTDDAFEQTVALKLIKRGMDSDAILHRFLNERQILASLQHPNIAHLIDGGTTDDNLPYFVMEYVKGETIVEYAASQNLNLSQRLALFRKVCSAVSYAHQNLVIHRDLKPSNILINETGIPKLLDFGIAKLLKSESTGETATRHFVFTPEYASPEQIRGENLTTATDVYSLGVILYELLTGSRPFQLDEKSFGQLVDIATRAEPTRPSAVRSSVVEHPKVLPFAHAHLRGDLDNIILKALRKEPERRYASVEQLSQDIKNHFRGLPVSARADTLRYRTETFVRRNPLLAGSVAVAFLLLIAGITATTILANRAERERQKAEQRFEDVRTIANSLIFEVNEKIDESPIKARQLLVTRAVEYLDKLAAEAGDDAGLKTELAAGYEKIGDVQAFHFGSGIGDTAGAIASHQKALIIRESLASSEPNDIDRRRDLAASYLRIADLSVTSGKTSVALEKYRLAVETMESARALATSDQKVRLDLARAYAKFGQGILRSGSISRALDNYEKAIALMQQAAAAEPENPRVAHGVSVYTSYAGYAKHEMGRAEESLADFKESLRIDRQIWESDQQNLDYLRNNASGRQWVAFALRSLRRFDEAREHLEGYLDIQLKLAAIDKSNIGDANSLADGYLELGWTESEAGKSAAAIKYLEKAIEQYGVVAAKDPNNISARRQISFSKRHLGDALARSGAKTRAISLYSAALKESEDLIRSDEQNIEFRYDKAICLSRLGENGESSETNLRAAEQILTALVSESPEHKQWSSDLNHVRKLIVLTTRSGQSEFSDKPDGQR